MKLSSVARGVMLTLGSRSRRAARAAAFGVLDQVLEGAAPVEARCRHEAHAAVGQQAHRAVVAACTPTMRSAPGVSTSVSLASSAAALKL